MKLMDIDQEHLGIPETSYDAVVRMPCADFQRICRDLQGISESVRIDVTKEGVKFSAEGEVGKGSQTLKQGGAISVSLRIHGAGSLLLPFISGGERH